MTLNYLNAVETGQPGVSVNGGHASAFYRKLIFNWLVKVCGWEDIEHSAISGDRYDDPQLTGTDGATDASDPTIFTSATGGFDSTMVGSQLLVCPTSPPAPSGGFLDPERNGFYFIRAVLDTNTLQLDQWRGVHTDGVPLSESGLNFEILRFRSYSTYAPVLNDYFVIRGTGGNTNQFDFKVTEVSGNYRRWDLQLSPFADWVAGSPGSFSPSTRLTGVANLDGGYGSDYAKVFGVADQSHAIIYIRDYADNGAINANPYVIYIGEIDSFNPLNDARAFVLGAREYDSGNMLNTMDTNLLTLGADDVTALNSSVGYVSYNTYSTSNALTGHGRARSDFSGRFVQTPLFIFEESAGFPEVRGTMRNWYMGHDNGGGDTTILYPFGTNLNKLRINNTVIDWNGSRVLDNVY